MFYPATAKLTEVRAWTKLWEGSGRGGMERERRHDNDDGKGHRPSTRRIGSDVLSSIGKSATKYIGTKKTRLRAVTASRLASRIRVFYVCCIAR